MSEKMKAILEKADAIVSLLSRSEIQTLRHFDNLVNDLSDEEAGKVLNLLRVSRNYFHAKHPFSSKLDLPLPTPRHLDIPDTCDEASSPCRKTARELDQEMDEYRMERALYDLILDVPERDKKCFKKYCENLFVKGRHVGAKSTCPYS